MVERKDKIRRSRLAVGNPPAGLTPQEEAFISGAKASVESTVQAGASPQPQAAERVRAEARRAFNLQLPESLYQRLKDFSESPYARRDESMTGIILKATEKELERLEARAKREAEEE